MSVPPKSKIVKELYKAFDAVEAKRRPRGGTYLFGAISTRKSHDLARKKKRSMRYRLIMDTIPAFIGMEPIIIFHVTNFTNKKIVKVTIA